MAVSIGVASAGGEQRIPDSIVLWRTILVLRRNQYFVILDPAYHLAQGKAKSNARRLEAYSSSSFWILRMLSAWFASWYLVTVRRPC